ncbi:hypothetical protein B0H17DRAFT_1177574 [Mycena rosella]|uniref:Uncharacterized protein n=1 Tax=Mycena rosella TaxID=1033263 RepID=A0AAD7GPD2_MYCRO|nr:hypothetical protein B0H17DRAFT_1177574 [Mycena rosella]
MVSFKNHVALANFQNRIQDARNVVWRDKGQPEADLPTLRDCLEHAATGGFRSPGLSGGHHSRSCSGLWSVGTSLRQILGCLRGPGTFTALHKFLLNALPLLVPATEPGLPSAFHKEEDSRKRTCRWHSALAGTISGGLGVFWEKRSRRWDIAQQVFVKSALISFIPIPQLTPRSRGLHGTYNNYSEKWGISIPYGAVIVFSLSCACIRFRAPSSSDPAQDVPKSHTRAFFALIRFYDYTSTGASVSTLSDRPRLTLSLSSQATFNIKAVQEHVVDIPALDRLIARSDVTSTNLSSLLSLRERALAGLPGGGPGRIPQRFLLDSPDLLGTTLRAEHFLPLAHFLRGRRATVGTMRSSAFLGATGALWQAVLCLKHGLYESLMAAPASSPLRKLLP